MTKEEDIKRLYARGWGHGEMPIWAASLMWHHDLWLPVEGGAARKNTAQLLSTLPTSDTGQSG